jgi:N-acetylmuramoyl-L-alanine amidase
MGSSVFKPLFAIVLAVSTATNAHGYELESVKGYVPAWRMAVHPTLEIAPLNPGRIQKFNLALDTLGIPREPAPDFSAFPTNGTIAQSEVQANLKYIDPANGLQRYLSISPGVMSAFQDFFSALFPQNLVEYTLQMSQTGTSSDSADLINHLGIISNQAKDTTQTLPLSGLKIVIDPGHMGTDFWDTEGGKYVEVDGQKVSEGKLNLWTAYLAANSLEALGATVILTRTEDGPVSTLDPLTYPMAAYLNQYFYSSLDDWMAPYLNLSDSVLQATIKSKPEVLKAYDSGEREYLFINGEDLEARSQIIDQEKPDVVLDIHYDASVSTQLQNLTNKIDAFVPGGFGAIETGARISRAQAINHLVDVRRFNASAAMAGAIVNAMSASECVPLETSTTFDSAIKVEDGVYARNLYITRRNVSALMVYLECLHYDHVSEFSKLANENEVGSYHGVSFNYPTRLKSVAAGISQGMLNYFKR